MQFGAILLLSVGLAMDAMAVSATRGLQTKHIRLRHVGLVAGFFGGFQALMPFLGWLLGRQLGAFVAAVGHWIAFVLLGFIGSKMLWESLREGDGEPEAIATVACAGDDESRFFGVKVMFMLAIATSIDAFAAGVSLSLVHAPILLSTVTIGLTTAALSALGLFAGKKFGSMLGRRLDVLGGLVLIGIGIRILFEH